MIYYLTIVGCIGYIFSFPLDSLWEIFTVTNKVKLAAINLIVNNFVANPTGFVSIIKYIVFAVFIIAAVVFWFVKKPKKESKESYV